MGGVHDGSMTNSAMTASACPAADVWFDSTVSAKSGANLRMRKIQGHGKRLAHSPATRANGYDAALNQTSLPLIATTPDCITFSVSETDRQTKALHMGQNGGSACSAFKMSLAERSPINPSPPDTLATDDGVTTHNRDKASGGVLCLRSGLVTVAAGWIKSIGALGMAHCLPCRKGWRVMPKRVKGLFGFSGGIAMMLLMACSQVGKPPGQPISAAAEMGRAPEQVVVNEEQLMVANDPLTFDELKQRVPQSLSAEEGARVLIKVEADRIIKDDATYSLQARGGARGSAHGGGGGGVRGHGGRGGGYGGGYGRGWGGRGFYGGYGAWGRPFFNHGLYSNYWYYPYNNYLLPYTWNAGAYTPYWGTGLNYSPFFYNYGGGLYPFTYNWGVPAFTTPAVQPVIQQPVMQTVAQPVMQQPVLQQPMVQQQPVTTAGTATVYTQTPTGTTIVNPQVIAPGTTNTTLGGIWAR
jgi:hypothetical protein